VDAGKCERELEVATAEGRFEEEGWRVRKDGTLFWACVTITALRERDGTLVGFAKVTRDLSEKRAVEEKHRALAAEQAALAERIRVQEFQERFLAILGHDLRNPLAAIDMGVSLLRQRGAAESSESRILGRMETSSRRMTRMIDQILDFTRTRLSGALSVEPQPMDLGSMLREMAEEVRVAHPDRVVDLRCPAIPGRWDRDRLEQVFSNLLGNAMSYGDPSAPVRVTALIDGTTARGEVHNEGPPIPDALSAMIFDPFRRGDRDSREKKTAGLGLGLYISREIIRAHGGDVTVRSSARDGTTFRVSLPREPDAPGERTG